MTTTNSKTISTGTFIRNHSNFYFRVIAMDNKTVRLEEYNANGPMGTFRNIPTDLFNNLVKLKNYETAKFFKSIKTGNWMEKRDIAANRGLGLERYLVQQPLYVLDKMGKRRF